MVIKFVCSATESEHEVNEEVEIGDDVAEAEEEQEAHGTNEKDNDEDKAEAGEDETF